MEFSSTILKNLTFLMIFLLIYFLFIHHISNLEAQKVQTIILKTETIFYLSAFTLLISLLIIFRKDFSSSLKNIKKDVWLLMFFIFILALLIREIFPPKTCRLFFDEDIYLDMAKQITKQFSSCLCNFGNASKCFKCELMKWPVGHPFLLSLPFLIFGSSDIVASHFMIFLSSLSVIFIFLSSYLIFENKKIAFFSSLVLSLLPVHILWSVTSSADVTFAFFTSLTLFFSILSAKSNNLKIHIISLLALALAVQAKTEGVILLPLCFFSQVLLNSKYSKLLKNKLYVLAIISSFLLMSIYFIHFFYSSRTDTWGSSGEKISIIYLKNNFFDNLEYWFEINKVKSSGVYEGKQLYHPLFFTLISIFGLISLFKKNLKIFILLSTWFGLLFLLYASFYAGSVYYGVDVRYVLPQYIPFSILCGFGFFSILNLLKKIVNEKIALLFLIVLVLSYFSLYIPKISTPEDKIFESYGARLYRKSAISFASDVSNDCYFISHVSSIYSWLGKGHVQVWYVYQPELVELIKNNKCVIFDEGYWCAIPVDESRSCLEFNQKYNLRLLNRVNDNVENKVYSFYEISEKNY
jgi:4-amino-4-deoxy-L-arabinose transferase-like glycosyltransferase